LAHEGQVIRLGSFLAGLTHPVLGLDHFLAMVSVGVVSAIIGGRAIWTVPATFVAMMAVGGLVGRGDLGLGATAIETGIAISVILLGVVIAAQQQLEIRIAMGAVAFFGLFHGYAHGAEIPTIARPALYAVGFLVGTALLHLSGVVIGDVAGRYRYGRPVLRISGAGVGLLGALFLVGVL
jgi:urease accessory protein